VAVRIYFVPIYFAILLATPVSGQTVEPPPAFEAATVKLNIDGAVYYRDALGQFEMRNFPLIIFIFKAYGVNSYSLSGPDWLGSVKVDVVAKLPASAAGLPVKERGSMVAVMLQALLAERFKLKVHREERLIPGYALVVAPGGLKMRRVETHGGALSRRGALRAGAPLSRRLWRRREAPWAGRCET
jgi:uncharacterized protein (TIGR03435 family)